MKIADAGVERGSLPDTRPSGRLAAVILAVAGVVAVVLHVVAFDRFPTPWVDEAHFLVPALRLARHATLSVPELNAPEGVFWMMDGYYALLAAAFLLLPDTLVVARATSLLFTLGSLTAFAVVTRRLDVPPLAGAVVAAAWVLAPHVVIAGNNARMEAVVILTALAAVALLACGRSVAALATAALTPVLHPAGFVVAVVVAGALVAGRADLRPRGIVSWLAIALAVAVITLETVHVLAHWGVAVDDVAFQFTRKRQNNPVLFDLERAPFLLPAAGGLVLLWLARRSLGARTPVLVALVGLALGFGAVQGSGQEIWYGVYAEPTSLALLALAGLGALTLTRDTKAPPGATTAASCLVALVPAMAAVVWWATPPTQGFVLNDVRRGEWSAYVDGALAALERLDATRDRPTVVAVDGLSSLTPVLVTHHWDYLEFVQETPVSPIEGATDALGRPIDFWLTMSPRGTPPPLLDPTSTLGVTPFPAISYSSPHGDFVLRLYAVAQAGDAGGRLVIPDDQVEARPPAA